MYLNLGQAMSVWDGDILGVFDLDNTTWSFRTRAFLDRAEEEGRVRYAGSDLPRSFVLCQRGQEPSAVYLSQVNTATLIRRAEQGQAGAWKKREESQ